MWLVPRFEIGVRHDGGDAETGFGLDVGAGLAWTDPARGVKAKTMARGLLTHEAGGFRERGFASSLAWDPASDTERGPSLKLRQRVGADASGGMDALLRPDTARILGAGAGGGGGGGDLGRRALEARLDYGMGLFGGGWTGTPSVGLGLTEPSPERELTLGWRLAEARRAGLGFGLDVEGTRREREAAATEHRFSLGLGWRLEGFGRERFELRFEGARANTPNDDGESRIGLRITASW